VATQTRLGGANEDRYPQNLLSGAPPARVVDALTDPHLGSSWSPAAGDRTGSLELALRKATAFDRIRLGEDITRGQHVQQFAVDTWTGTAWTTVATGTTIGYARILVLPAPVTTDRIRIRLLQSRATPHLSTLGLYLKEPTADR
jgi:alpha-L-fucosidase